MPRVSSITLRVGDLERSLAFYRDVLGLALGESHGHGPVDDPWDGTPHAECMWEADGRRFFFVVQQAAHGTAAFRTEFGLAVEDLDATIARVRDAGTRVLHEPRAMPWGTRECRVADPDGNVVVIVG